MVFRFDTYLSDLFSPGRFDAFLDKLDNAYAVAWDLVGGAAPYGGARMEFETSRALPAGTEGTDGQPVKWSVLSAAKHIAHMNRLGADLTETPLHEIGHNFDRAKWTFEPNALTIFKIYHHMDQTGDTMAIDNYDRLISGGADYKAYIKSHAKRTGRASYDDAMARGVYSPYALAYSLSNIADAVGWDAVKQAFRYIDALAPNQIPAEPMGKLNLFLSKIQDFGGIDVFSMFTEREKVIYQKRLGGVMEYAAVPPPEGNSCEIGGVLYGSGLTASLSIHSIEIDVSANRLVYDMSFYSSPKTETSVTGSKCVYRDPSATPRDSEILAMNPSVMANWELLCMTLENPAEADFLLPSNREALAGKPVIKIALRQIVTGAIYYFEGEIEKHLFDGAQAISVTPSETRKKALDASIYWYLDYNNTIQDGAKLCG